MPDFALQCPFRQSGSHRVIMDFNPFRMVRQHLRDQFFAFWRKALAVDDGKMAVAAALRNQLSLLPAGLPSRDQAAELPYADLGRAQEQSPAATKDSPVFFTSRFRSGSTMTWNLFREAHECVAYYEPLNERRWFDPAHCRSVDPTHRGVSNYAAEYQDLEILSKYYEEDWIDRDLLLTADAWKPRLLAYIRILVAHGSRRPLLKFNRIDFRLPWIRRHFPQAEVVHLFRHPRDQWCSTLLDPGSFGTDGRVADFEPHDKFYLLRWARDLKYHFPFLAVDAHSHPYALSYFIWRLSYLVGVRLADYSLSFESLVTPPFTRLEQLADQLGIDLGSRELWQAKIIPPRIGRWREYADEGWFRRIEEHCESVLSDFLAPGPPAGPELPTAANLPQRLAARARSQGTLIRDDEDDLLGRTSIHAADIRDRVLIS